MASATPIALMAPAALAAHPERALSLDNLHTGESIRSVFWRDGGYVAEGLLDISWLLRDHRSGDALAFDPRLLDLLFAVRAKLHSKEPFQVISGYRSPATNARLREAGAGVAKNSLHMQGMAVDVRLPGRALTALRETATEMKAGGVGFYPRPEFVHLDTGRVRYW